MAVLAQLGLLLYKAQSAGRMSGAPVSSHAVTGCCAHTGVFHQRVGENGGGLLQELHDGSHAALAPAIPAAL